MKLCFVGHTNNIELTNRTHFEQHSRLHCTVFNVQRPDLCNNCELHAKPFHSSLLLVWLMYVRVYNKYNIIRNYIMYLCVVLRSFKFRGKWMLLSCFRSYYHFARFIVSFLFRFEFILILILLGCYHCLGRCSAPFPSEFRFHRFLNASNFHFMCNG